MASEDKAVSIACTISAMKSREVFFAVALLFLGVPVAYFFGSPSGMAVAGVISVGCLVAAFRRKSDDEEEFSGHHLFEGVIPWAETPITERKPNLTWSGYGFRDVTYLPDSGVRTGQGKPDAHYSKAFVLGFTNAPYADDQGTDASGLRAQIQWEYDTGITGPSFSPAMWLDEQCGKLDIPVGWCKWLLIGIKVANIWNGYGNSRIEVGEAPKSYSDIVPSRGTMSVKLIGATGAVWFEATWSWSEDPWTYHPSIKQLK